MRLLSDLGRWWRWRMRRGKVHIYGISEYRTTGVIVGHADSNWRIEDDRGRVFFAPETAEAHDLTVGDRVELEPLAQSTAAGRVTNLWTIVRKLSR